MPLWLEGGRRLRDPSLSAALLAGVLTVFAPFLILQPAPGFGIAAFHTPRPAGAWAESAYASGLWGEAVCCGAGRFREDVMGHSLSRKSGSEAAF
ncbi:DUF2938 family protein [Enterobacter sp.]|uniref:DUF2938 family protein n=1 Tax=Enterobacter sp. TaxID=42895 RepID=UPI0039936DA2